MDDENFDDNSIEVFDLDDQYSNKRVGSSGKKSTSHFHHFDKQRINIRGNRRSSNYSNNRSLSSGNSSYRQSSSKEQFLQAK